MMVYPGFRLSHSWVDALPLVGIPVLFIVVGALLLGMGWRWPRAVLTALGCFTLAVLPILGFTKITYLAYSPVADHLQYLGLPAVVALVCGGASVLLRKLSEIRRPAGLVLTILATGICITLTWRQAEIYHNEQTLWEANVAVGERAWVPHAFLARYLQDNAEPSPEQDALILQHLRRAVELAPENPIPHEQLAEICRYLGFPLESRAHFAIAVDLVPEIARDHNPMQGPRSSSTDDTTRALAALRSVLEKHPQFHYSRLTLESLETPASAPATRRE
jgi:hypothetical protein